MANAITKSGQVVSVVFDGATPFDLAAEIGASAAGLRLKKLVFYPAAANDVFTVRTAGAGGPVLYKYKDTAGSGRDADFLSRGFCFPYVVGNEVTNGSLISFHYE